jgi:hypothetical protein
MFDENGDECHPLTFKEQLQIALIYVIVFGLVGLLAAAPFLF